MVWNSPIFISNLYLALSWGDTIEVSSSAFALENSGPYAIMRRWLFDDQFSRFNTISARVEEIDGWKYYIALCKLCYGDVR